MSYVNYLIHRLASHRHSINGGSSRYSNILIKEAQILADKTPVPNAQCPDW